MTERNLTGRVDGIGEVQRGEDGGSDGLNSDGGLGVLRAMGRSRNGRRDEACER